MSFAHDDIVKRDALWRAFVRAAKQRWEVHQGLNARVLTSEAESEYRRAKKALEADGAHVEDA